MSRKKDTRELSPIKEEDQEFYDNYYDSFGEEEYVEVEEEPEKITSKTNSKRKRKKRKKKRYLLKFFCFCLFVALLIVFANSSYFDVDKIQVKNNSNYSQEQIIKMSGITLGTNIFKVKKSKVKEKLLKDSYIEGVKIKRALPSTIELTIKERKEIAVIQYGKDYIIIDNKGYVLAKTKKEPKLTRLKGLTIKKMDKGELIEVKEENVLEETLSMLKAMEYSDLFFKKIDMTSVVIKAYIYDQLVCKGTPENILKNMKNGNLEAIMSDLYKRNITKGVISVGADEYCSFSPNVEN